jgi:hypothetical protein
MASPAFSQLVHAASIDLGQSRIGAVVSEGDREAFRRAVAAAPLGDWPSAVHAASRLSLADMFLALESVGRPEQTRLSREAREVFGSNSLPYRRIEFARAVAADREIIDAGLPDHQVNAGRAFLGCTPLSDGGVRRTIDESLAAARNIIADTNNDDPVAEWRGERTTVRVAVASIASPGLWSW